MALAVTHGFFTVRLTKDIRLWGGGRMKAGTKVSVYRAANGQLRISGKGLTTVYHDDFEPVWYEEDLERLLKGELK